jgi:subtilisin family serine protease
MKISKFNKKTVLLIYIIACFLSIPIAMNINPTTSNAKLDKDLTINSNLISDLSSILTKNDMNGVNVKFQSQNGLFDEKLSQILLNKTYVENHYSQKIKVIILFDNNIEKSGRIAIINSFLNDYTLLDNYNIIPGLYLSISLSNLVEAFQILNGVQGVKKIYLSSMYQAPYVDNELPSSSSLNPNNYPNWWIPAISANNLNYNGSGVRVAVVDTGIYDHSDYNVVLSRSFVSGEAPNKVNDDYGHGTHVAGIIAGDGESSSGKYRGVAPGVSLINARAGNYSGLAEGDIISAIDWCVTPVASGGAGADIISMSFGGGTPDADDPMTLTIDNAANNYGVLLVASAGNSGPGYFTGGSPASGTDVISVGAIDQNNKLASFSSWGPSLSYLGYPDIIAPGVNIISTEAPNSVISDEKRFVGDYFDYPSNYDYIPLSGTSMACPFVSGALAILLEAFPTMTPETGRIALIEGANKNLDGSYDYLKDGAGILNVSASLNFLMNVNATTHGDVNKIASITPNTLPVKPFDLLTFPGDHQAFNLTLLSGENQTIDIQAPNNINGLKISLDKSQVVFSNNDVSFVTLDVMIEDNASPGQRTFTLNITSGGVPYDSVEVSIDVRFPEYKILMDSFHGLNDWFPDISFYQVGFYDAMKAITDMNISIDYFAQYWTPNYNADSDNSILTEERLFQYDLVILQNPILPYNQLEMKNLKTYFDSGGNILFLGTRSNDLCIQNINSLFSELGLDLQVNQETLIDENWLGVGAAYQVLNVSDFNSPEIFNGVDGFGWAYGNTFSVAGNVQAIATIDGKCVASAFDGRSAGKGRLVAFGDLNWLYTLFSDQAFKNDHSRLVSNLMDYFLKKDTVSLNINVQSARTSNPNVNISVYALDQTMNSRISSTLLESRLNVSINHLGYYKELSMISLDDGIAYNVTLSLPSTSYIPYDINVNITIGSTTYFKSSKVLYYDSSSVPQINSMNITGSATRSGSDSITLDAELDASNYNSTTYMAIYPSTYYSIKQTINKTLPMNNLGHQYSSSFTPTSNDPSGYVLAYILPIDPATNYSNPNSERILSQIINNPPKFDEIKSTFTVNGKQYTLDETHSDNSTNVITTTQGDRFDFDITALDSVPYEDPNSQNMRISVNLFAVSITPDNYLMLIYPNTFPMVELGYSTAEDSHVGSFTLPYTMQYSSIRGTESISTTSTYNFNTKEGYLSIFIITIFDSDGGTENFVIVLQIQQGLQFDPTILIIIISVIALIVIFSIIYSVRHRKKKRGATKQQAWRNYESTYSISNTQESSQEGSQKGFLYCPFCGHPIRTNTKFCPSCGKSLVFTSNE